MEEKCSYFSAEEIADGSYKIFNNGVERPFAYCYLVVGENYALLIDSIIGLGNVKKFCETLTDKKIVLVNTHAHTDHIGGNFFFDSCYIHPRDMALAASSFGYRKEQLYEMARQNCPEEYRDRIVLDDNFADWDPIKMLPVYDGDEFDLGDRIIEVAEAAGHTEGSIILIDHKASPKASAVRLKASRSLWTARIWTARSCLLPRTARSMRSLSVSDIGGFLNAFFQRFSV